MKLTRLGEIADIFLGVTHTPEYTDRGVPFLSVKDISTGTINFDRCQYISEKEYHGLPKGAKPQVGDMLFCRVGTLGKPIIIEPGTPRFGSFVSLGFLRNKDDTICYLPYLKWWMNSKSFLRQVQQNVKGASQVNLNTGWLSKFNVPLPSVETQRDTFEKLDKVQRVIELKKQQIGMLDELVKAQFGKMFGGNKYPYVTTKEICEFITKGTTPKTGDIIEEYHIGYVPFLKVYNLSFDGSLLFMNKPQYVKEEVHHNFLARSKVYPGDVLMNIVGPPLGKFTLIPEDFCECNINQAIAIFRATDRVKPRFLLYALMQPETLQPFINSAVGVRQQNLSLQQCRDLRIPLPPINLQDQFSTFVQQVEKQKASIQQSLNEMQILFDSLMQTYFD